MEAIKLGGVSVTRVEESHGPVGMTPEQFFPDSDERDWRDSHDWLVPSHLGGDDNVVQVGYLDHLAAAGIRPADVDLVVNAHLHVDHIGWNTRLDGQWVPTFPNATYLMPRVDFEYWNPAVNPSVSKGVNENAFEDSVAPVQAAGLVQLWEGEHVIDGSLRLLAAPGHTSGASVLELVSGNDKALFAGDIVHTPLQVPHPGFSSCFCEDPATAQATRRDLLGWAADNQALVLPAHFSGRSALTVARAGSAFRINDWGPFPAY